MSMRLVICSVFCAIAAQGEILQGEGKYEGMTSEEVAKEKEEEARLASEGLTKFSFKPPELNQEEEKSWEVPDYLYCSACHGVSHQAHKAFWAAERKFLGERRFKKGDMIEESQYLDVMDGHCEGETFSDYGVKKADGRTYLQGPGIEKAETGPGMTLGGGIWAARMVRICQDLIGHFGEDRYYELYHQFRKDKVGFRDLVCADQGLGHCLEGEELAIFKAKKLKKKKKTKKKKKKKKKKMKKKSAHKTEL